MTNDIKALIDYYEREKGLSREKFSSLWSPPFSPPTANGSRFRQHQLPEGRNQRGQGQGAYFADLEVVPDEEYSDKFNQIPLSLAVKLDKNAVLHDLLPTNITPKGFGRIAVQTARQTMLQKLLDAERKCSTTSSRTAPEIW